MSLSSYIKAIMHFQLFNMLLNVNVEATPIESDYHFLLFLTAKSKHFFKSVIIKKRNFSRLSQLFFLSIHCCTNKKSLHKKNWKSYTHELQKINYWCFNNAFWQFKLQGVPKAIFLWSIILIFYTLNWR